MRSSRYTPPPKKPLTPREQKRVAAGLVGGGILGGVIAGPPGAVAGLIIGTILSIIVNQQEKKRTGR